MKKILLLAVIIILPMCAKAQTYVKLNGLYWAAGVVNGSVETWLNDNMTLNVDAVFSPWKSINGYPFILGQLVPEVRYYTNSIFDGFYVGAFASLHTIKMPTFGSIENKEYYKGSGYGLGVSAGYQFFITNRWNLDLYIGYGWTHLNQKRYDRKTDEATTGYNGKGKWLPMKVGVAISYAL